MNRTGARPRSEIVAARLLRRAAGVAAGAAALALAAAEPACTSSSSAPPAPAPTTTPPPPLDCSTGDAGGWPMFGGNVCGTRAGLASDPITPQTVSRLTVKWKFTASGDVSATPAVVAGQVYFGDWGGTFYRLDAASGQVVWSRSVADLLNPSQDGGTDAAAAGVTDGGVTDGAGTDGETPDSETPEAAAAGATDGGAHDATTVDGAVPAPEPAPETEDAATASDAGTSLKLTQTPLIRNTPVVTNGLVIAGIASSPVMVALDQDTGALVWRTSLDTNPFAVITSSPAVDGGRIYVGVASGEEAASLAFPGYTCCTFRGSVAALDATTGKILWQTPMIDDATYRNGDGKPSGFAGAAIWSSPTIDRNRRLLYVSTGNNYSAPPAVADGGAPLPAGDHIESIVAVDEETGAIRWAQRMTQGDIWTFGNSPGPDWDFGGSPNLFQIAGEGGVHDVVGAGQKSGVYWAVDADTHAVLWKTQVGPGGHFGGIHWGTATDATHVYVGVNDQTGTPYKVGGAADAGETPVGSWAALDPISGATLWQVADPALTAPLNGVSVNGPVTAVNGVVFGGSMDSDGMMYAFDGASGKVLWSFKSGGSVYGGAAVADGVVYWGSGYPPSRLGFGSTGQALYAFALAP